MTDVCDMIKVLIKHKQITTDNNIFRLHYKVTTLILLIFSFLVSAKQYFGEPIDCESGNQDKYTLDTYCWIFSTFTVKDHLYGDLGKTMIAPGVGASQAVLSHSNSNEIIVQKYYQWVCIILFLQAALFYAPRYLWKIWEAGRMKLLVKDYGSPLVQPSWNQSYKESLIKYMLSNSCVHNIYTLRFAVCELINLINVIVQIYLMDLFLGGQFRYFGKVVAAFSSTADPYLTNPMSHVFPKLAKCTYSNFGASGSIQIFDALCILPLNVINEKIYIILWFWFIILGLISILALFFRLLVICNSTLRIYLLMAHVRYLNKSMISLIVNHLTFGDWFVLYQIGKNINPIIFQDLVIDLGHAIQSKQMKNYQFKI